MTWREQAACFDSNPDVFFPASGEPLTPALQVCGRCPVQPECLNHALTTNQNNGVWGGASANQRHRLRKETA